MAPCALVYTAYSDDEPQMYSRFRCCPPKHRLATVSGMWILPSRSPSALDRHGAGGGRKARRAERDLRLLGRLEMGVRVAAAGERPERQAFGGSRRSTRLAERRHGFG